MKHLFNTNSFPRASDRPLVLAMGNFDGLHRGHFELLRRLRGHRERVHGLSVVLTFTPHPKEILRPGTRVVRVTDDDERVKLMSEAGVDFWIEQSFDIELARMSGRDFWEKHIARDLNSPRVVVVGEEFRMGAGRDTGVEELRSWGLEVDAVEPVLEAGRAISTSHIRELLSDGHVSEARKLLGRPYAWTALVSAGQGRGRTIGVPTINMRPQAGKVGLPLGVYVTRCQRVDGGQVFASVTNVGQRPTVSNSDEIHVESHLFDFSGSVYGENWRVEFLHWLRPERKFESFEALKAQIARDLEEARRLSAI